MLEGHNFFESDSDVDKTSFSVFVTILYIKVLYILVMILEPSIQQPWFISKGDKQISIPKGVISNLANQDIIAINFLYQNYKNEFKGSILNEEDGFNVQLQVCTFFNVILQIWSRPKEKFRLLIITPEYLIHKWSETLKKYVGVKVLTVGPTTCPEDFDQIDKVALILSFDYIKFAEALSEYNFVSVVIDHFDAIANKLIIRKLAGEFNIGLTRRNFYTEPDQKLQWTMLNWIHPECVGRLKDFYEADNDNFANLRDNYHHWWLTLTWDYCDTFKKQLDSSSYVQNLKRKKGITGRKKNAKKVKSKSSDENSDDESLTKKTSKNKLKSKATVICVAENDKSNSVECEVKYSKESSSCNKENYKNEKNYNDFSDSSDDTVEYNVDSPTYSALDSSTTIKTGLNKLDDDDDDDENILLNIIKKKINNDSIDSSDNTVEYNVDSPTHSALDSSTTTKTALNKLDDDDDENILLNIIEGISSQNSTEISDSQSQLELKKEELYSQMFEDIPNPKSGISSPDTSEDFLRSLINQ